MVPVDALAFIIAHAREEYPPSFGLLNDIFNNLGTPIVVVSVVEAVLADT
jgi:hypothetical protein